MSCTNIIFAWSGKYLFLIFHISIHHLRVLEYSISVLGLLTFDLTISNSLTPYSSLKVRMTHNWVGTLPLFTKNTYGHTLFFITALEIDPKNIAS